MPNQIESYWDNEWKNRIGGFSGGVKMNIDKMAYIIRQLWKRSSYIPLKKIEIGCGPATHIQILRNTANEWGKNYIGFDLSQEAVSFARSNGVDALCMDFAKATPEMIPCSGVQLFLFLDVLEHIQDHDSIAKKVQEFSDKDGFCVFGNVPLYRSKHEELGGFERSVDIYDVRSFLKKCGITKFDHHIYGVDGFPYMVFEGQTEGFGK